VWRITIALASLSTLFGRSSGKEPPRPSVPPSVSYPFCPPPLQRRTGAGEGYVFDACGGFDREGNVTNGWEVATNEDGRRRETHWARGKLNGQIRVWFADGDSWIGQYADGELEGRREYWHASGGKWQEAELHRGQLTGVDRAWFRDGSLQSIFKFDRGQLVANIEWREDGRIVQKDGDYASLLGALSIAEVRRINARPACDHQTPGRLVRGAAQVGRTGQAPEHRRREFSR
jgi:hypothetical protein